MIIDCHGHYTTAPAPHNDCREAQLAAFARRRARRRRTRTITDDEIRETHRAEPAAAAARARRRPDDLLAARLGDGATTRATRRSASPGRAPATTSIERVVELYPDNFVGVCQLPQSPGVPIAHSVAELERCVRELGFVGCNLNPDPSGGHWTLAAADRPLLVPVLREDGRARRAGDGPRLGAAATRTSTPPARTTSTPTPPRSCSSSRATCSRDFPDLRFVIPHGGGAVPYHWGRYRGLADMLKRPPLATHVMRNVFFDTCVYHQPGIDLLFEVIDVDNILFGSEMVGAVRGIDPETGHYFDDTKRYIDALGLSAADQAQVFERQRAPRLPAPRRAADGEGAVSMPPRSSPDAGLAGLRRPERRRKPTFPCRRRARSTRTATCSVPATRFPYAPERKYTPMRCAARTSCWRCATSSASTAT